MSLSAEYWPVKPNCTGGGYNMHIIPLSNSLYCCIHCIHFALVIEIRTSAKVKSSGMLRHFQQRMCRSEILLPFPVIVCSAKTTQTL